MELLQKQDLEKLLSQLGSVDEGIAQIHKLYRPAFNGEHYLTGEEVCKALKITKRTLQQYRDDALLAYVALPGKMLYKESDILAMLQSNYVPAFSYNNSKNLLPLHR